MSVLQLGSDNLNFSPPLLKLIGGGGADVQCVGAGIGTVADDLKNVLFFFINVGGNDFGMLSQEETSLFLFARRFSVGNAVSHQLKVPLLPIAAGFSCSFVEVSLELDVHDCRFVIHFGNWESFRNLFY